MLKIAAALEALGLLYTLSGGLSEIAYAGHLGGIAAGFLAARAIKSGKLAFLDKLSFKLPRRKSEKYTKSASEYSYRVNISNPKDLKMKSIEYSIKSAKKALRLSRKASAKPSWTRAAA